MESFRRDFSTAKPLRLMLAQLVESAAVSSAISLARFRALPEQSLQPTELARLGLGSAP